MTIAVCALTYRRPEGLARLLDGLAALTFGGEVPGLTVIVVDNDAEAGARQLCQPREPSYPWLLKYVVEPQRGIAPARNAALANVGDAEWICFIDDDEVPHPRWLDELLGIQRRFNADVVGGPVIPHFPKAPPSWILKGRFFDYNRYPTGTRVPYAYTNNVLFRARILTDLALRFDDRWALMGGEDRRFFQRVGMAGYKIVWADEALVTEWVPESRVRVRWVLQRGFRYGNSACCIELDLRPGLATRVRLLALAGYRIIKGVFFLPLTWPLGSHLPIIYLRHICVGAGILAAWFGCRYEEYRRTHGG
jgi:glycosyltransferase involved in cell wall biosynthesis